MATLAQAHATGLQALQDQAAAERQQQQATQTQSQKLQDYLMGQQKQQEELKQAKEMFQMPGVDTAKYGDISLAHKPINTAAQATKDDNQRLRTINSIKKDFNDLAGKSPQQVRAAQNVLNALDRGDITTLGAVKAQLPLLEGENYKPTDAERKMMLQPTGQGTFESIKNYLGGDNASISDSQAKALRSYAQKRLVDEQDRLGQNRKEVLGRWGKHIKTFSPEDMQDISSTLGTSSENLMGQLQKKAPQQPAQTPGFNPDEYLKK